MTHARRDVTSPRVFIVATACVFVTSCLFPIAASLLEVDRIARWIGMADVAIAATLLALCMVITWRKPSHFEASVVAASFRTYRALASGFLVLLVLFFVAGGTVRWSILLPGLAWRAWLLTMVLPSCLAMWHTGRRSVVSQE